MASALTISASRCSARSRARSDLPVAVGPTIATTRGRGGDPSSGRCAVIVAEPTQGAPAGGDRGPPAMSELEPQGPDCRPGLGLLRAGHPDPLRGVPSPEIGRAHVELQSCYE